MAHSFSFRIEVDNTDKVLDAADEAVQRALEAIGMQVENYAKAKCPVDTGLLRNSITHAVSGKGASLKGYHASYGSNRTASGKRRSASSKNAGSVKMGGYGSDTIGSADEAAVYIGSNVEYAAYVETGHTTKSGKKVAPQPYLKPAVMDHVKELERLAKTALEGSW